MGLQRALCAGNGTGSGAARAGRWWRTFANSTSAQSSARFADAGSRVDYAPAAAKSVGGAARERDRTNRPLAYERMRRGGGADCAWPEHAMGMSGADDGGVLSRGYGAGGAQVVRRQIRFAASAGRGISDTLFRLCGPVGCLGCVCDRADDRVEGGKRSGGRYFVRSCSTQTARLRWGADETGG